MAGAGQLTSPERLREKQQLKGLLLYTPVPPTHTDSSVFIRILRGIYGHTDTTRHYTEARFRHQAQYMLLVDLVAVSVRPTETFL